MSYPLLDLSNLDNWDAAFSGNFEAQRSPGNTTVLPIPEIVLPDPLDRHILAVYASCSTAKPTWHFAGYLNQRLQIGLIRSTLPDTEIHRQKIWLNRLTLITLPRLSPTFFLSYEVPKWFQDFSLSIFKYTGPESDSTENLINQIINVEFPQLEGKIDSLH